MLIWIRKKLASLLAWAKRKQFPKRLFRRRYIVPILVVGFAAAGFYIRALKPWLEAKKRCRDGIAIAEQQGRQDKFEEGLATLDEVRETCQDGWLREDDVLRARLEAVKAIVEYDQIKRVSKNDLKVIERKWEYAKKNEDSANAAAIMVLKGMIEELHYRPDKAIEQYEAAKTKDPKYVAALIRLGYIYFKWGLEGSNWERKAMEYLDDAARIAAQSDLESNRNTVWPDLNKASIHLSQAQRLVNQCTYAQSSSTQSFRCAETDDVLARLSNAKSNLEKAVSLLPNNDNPRLHLLWGHYYFLEGRLRRLSRLGDPDPSYHAARVSLLNGAIAINPDMADAHLLLGAVYEELAKSKDPLDKDYYERSALAEYNEAVSLDRCNIIARSAYAQLLSRQNSKDEAAEQAQAGIKLIDRLDEDLQKHFRQTNRDDLREWLRRTLEEYSEYRVQLLPMAQALQSQRVTTVIRQEVPTCQ